MKCILLLLAAIAPAAPLQAQRGEALIRFDHYHASWEIEAYLQAVTAQHASLATLIEIGRSREGRRILAVEISNPATGLAREKPGFYVDGNIHGGEVLGGEGALYFIDYLLTRYGTDTAITRLVDHTAFYVVPIVNPDGRYISVHTPENHRWNARPVDEDGDGLVDEDPPDDVDADGRILRMRAPNPNGRWKALAADPRRMTRRADGETGGRYYDLYREGIDNDGDGRFNEDGVGGVDLNRNFPANWSPAQFASGPFPLSEPETHALVAYITDRPNIAGIHTYHTSGGLLLRFPTLADQNWDFPESDLRDYRAIAEDGVGITGYANYAYEKQKIVDLMNPGHGVFNDWGSLVFGVFTMTTEMWKRPLAEGEDALFAWGDSVLGPRGFRGWAAFDHPQLGSVELGGWDRWSTASPPEDLMEVELERNNRWVLTFAEKLPRMAILDAQPVASFDAITVSASVANVGWMPTATAHARDVLKTAKPVTVTLHLSNAELVDGSAVVELGVLAGTRGGPPEGHTVEWRIRITDDGEPSSATIVVRSEKAGRARRTIGLAPGR